VIANSHSADVVRQLAVPEVLFVEAVGEPEGASAIVASVQGDWREDGPRVTLGRLADVLGGAPLGPAMAQLELPFSPVT
jgi:hypothetical protein